MVETKKHLCQQDGHKIMNKDSFQQLISTRQKNWKFVPIGLVLKIARSATTLVEARQLTHSFKVNFTLFHYLEFFKFNCFWASSNHRLYLLHYNSEACLIWLEYLSDMASCQSAMEHTFHRHLLELPKTADGHGDAQMTDWFGTPHHWQRTSVIFVSFKVNFTLILLSWIFFKFSCFSASLGDGTHCSPFGVAQDCRWPWRRPNVEVEESAEDVPKMYIPTCQTFHLR